MMLTVGLDRRASQGAASVSRSDFKLFLWPYDGSSNLQGGTSCIDYYVARGIGSVRNFQDISGTTGYVQATIEANVGFWAGRTEAQKISLWYLDNESTHWNWDATDASTCITDTENMVSWAKAKWATFYASDFTVGVYSPNGPACGIKGGSSYVAWLNTPQTLRQCKLDNDAINPGVAAALDFLSPEVYVNSGTMADIGCRLSFFCDEYARLGLTKPLIPFLQAIDTVSYDEMYGCLEACISRPEVSGAVMWGVNTGISAPTYYDGKAWMQAALDFVTAYGLTIGTPF